MIALGGLIVSTKRHKPEKIVSNWRQVEALVGQGMNRINVIREASITKLAYYRWRKHYEGMGKSRLKELKRLQNENERSRRAVSDLDVRQARYSGDYAGKLLSPERRCKSTHHVCEHLRVASYMPSTGPASIDPATLAKKQSKWRSTGVGHG